MLMDGGFSITNVEPLVFFRER